MTNKEVLVKICGLSTAETLETTITAGADLAGFVFFEKSPRHLDLETARLLNHCAQGRIKKVALVVDSDDEMLAAIIAALAPDILQLHGHETPARVMDIRKRFHLPIIKAVGVKTAADILAARVYRQAADILLFDAKPAPDATVPGGAGVSFDWQLLHDLPPQPWMLSGGLDCDNVARAVTQTGAPAIDVSSGVESARGVKECKKIRRFVSAVRALSSSPVTV